MSEQKTIDPQLCPGYLVIVTKWWKEGDVVPEGWTTIGNLNAERVLKCPDCGKKQPAVHRAVYGSGWTVEQLGLRVRRLEEIVARLEESK